MKVTLKKLKAMDACVLQRKLFRKTFGDSVEVTLSNLRKAVKAGLDIDYFIDKFLDYEQRRGVYDDKKYSSWSTKYYHAEFGSKREGLANAKMAEARNVAIMKVLKSAK